MELPESFRSAVTALFQSQDENGLNPEAEARRFFSALEEKTVKRAWRVNTARIRPEKAAALMAAEFPELSLQPEDFLCKVPWARDGFYLPEGARAGQSVLFQLGLIYLQEASAMLPAEAAAAVPGERAADLCAAPGGKSLQILAQLKEEGLLLANDIERKRAKILQINLERSAAEPSLVSSADPIKDFPASFDAFFDLLICDVPCSGEGMFRRDPGAVKAWEAYGPSSAAAVQRALLERAARLLAPGGRIVYSTCTFNMEENEGRIAEFLKAHPNFYLARASAALYEAKGVRPGLIPPGEDERFRNCLRIWPQDGQGEGHFAAVLRKKEEPGETEKSHAARSVPISRKGTSGKQSPLGKKSPAGKRSTAAAEEAFRKFLRENFTAGDAWLDRQLGRNRLRFHGGKLHLLPLNAPDLSGLRLLKSGLYLGDIKAQKRGAVFSPSQSLLRRLKASDLIAVSETPFFSERMQRILAGQTIVLDEEEKVRLDKTPAPYMAFFAEGLPLCWGKRSLNMSTVKNLYPHHGGR